MFSELILSEMMHESAVTSAKGNKMKLGTPEPGIVAGACQPSRWVVTLKDVDSLGKRAGAASEASKMDIVSSVVCINSTLR